MSQRQRHLCHRQDLIRHVSIQITPSIEYSMLFQSLQYILLFVLLLGMAIFLTKYYDVSISSVIRGCFNDLLLFIFDFYLFEVDVLAEILF